MKDNTIEEIEKQINEKRQVPKEQKEQVKKEISINILIGIFLNLFFIFIFLGSKGVIIKLTNATVLKIFSLVFLGAAITLFEIAYKKDSGKIAINGIETLIVGIILLFLPYIIFEIKQSYYMFVGSAFGMYYLLKGIYLSKKSKISYIKKVSDIDEIIKKDKKQRKDREKTKKSIKKEVLIETTDKTNNETAVKKEITKQNNKIKEDIVKETKSKRGRPKKEVATTEKKERKINKEEKTVEEIKPKRGRPKKEVTTSEKRETKSKKEENTIGEVKPKRGRPRKVVENK